MTLLYLDIAVSPADVKFGEDLGFTKLANDVGYQREWVSIFFDCIFI